MLTFLEFYETFLGFMNFKLYHSLGFIYPPKVDQRKDANGELVDAIVLQSADSMAVVTSQDFSKPTNNSKSKARISSLKSKIAQLTQRSEGEEATEEVEVGDEEGANDQEMKQVFAEDSEEQEVSHQHDDFLNLFSKCRFFLSREVRSSFFSLLSTLFPDSSSFLLLSTLGSKRFFGVFDSRVWRSCFMGRKPNNHRVRSFDHSPDCG
jgi:hypothetical protein